MILQSVCLMLTLTTAAPAQSSAANPREKILLDVKGLETRLAAAGFALQDSRFSLGYRNAVTARLDPEIVRRLAPHSDRLAVVELLAQYVEAVGKLREAYSGDDFHGVVFYYAKGLLAQDLAARLRSTRDVDPHIGDRTIVVRYHDCLQQEWEREFGDLPTCSDDLLSVSYGSIDDPPSL